MQFPLMALDDIVNCRLNTNECARKRKRCQRQIIMMIIIERFKGAPWTYRKEGCYNIVKRYVTEEGVTDHLHEKQK